MLKKLLSGSIVFHVKHVALCVLKSFQIHIVMINSPAYCVIIACRWRWVWYFRWCHGRVLWNEPYLTVQFLMLTDDNFCLLWCSILRIVGPCALNFPLFFQIACFSCDVGVSFCEVLVNEHVRPFKFLSLLPCLQIPWWWLMYCRLRASCVGSPHTSESENMYLYNCFMQSGRFWHRTVSVRK